MQLAGSLAVNMSHTLLRPESPVFRAVNACMRRNFMQLAGFLLNVPDDGTIDESAAMPLAGNTVDAVATVDQPRVMRC